MNIYSTIFHTGQNPPELNVKSFAGTILRRMPNGNAPMFAMTSVIGTTQAKASTHGYFSKTMVFSRIVTGIESSAVLTTIPTAATDGAGLVPGQVLHVPSTGENLRVEYVGVNSIEVTREFGRVAAAVIPAGSTLIVVGSAHEEGSARPNPRAIATVYISTFTQIFRNAWALTDTARASYAELGYSNIAESKRDCMDFHSVDQESAIFFSQAYMGTKNGTPLHTTQGIIDAIREHAPANVSEMPNPNAVTYDDVIDALLPSFSYSVNVGDNTTRVAFCDATAMRTLQDIGRFFGEVTLTQKETSYGMIFSEFKFFKGRIILREHPLFNGLGINTGMAVIVDVPAVKLAYMDGRNAKVESYGVGGGENSHVPRDANAEYTGGHGVDAQGGSLTSEWALELLNPQGCAVITGLTMAARPVVNAMIVNTEAEPVFTDEVPAGA